jgi:hypothetical protein
MALFNKLGGMFTDNPVNRVGPTGQPLMGGSNITDLLTRSAGGLLGVDVRGRPEQLTAALAQIDPKAPDAEQQQLTILAQLGTPQQQIMAAQKIKANRKTKTDLERKEAKEQGISIIQDTLLNAENIFSAETLDLVGEAQLEYNVSSSELDSIYDAVKNARNIADVSSSTKDAKSTARGKARDKVTGEEYFVTEFTYKDGRPSKFVYTNSKGEQVTPENETETISGTTGQSGTDQDVARLRLAEEREKLERETLKIKTQFNISEEEAKKWLTEKQEASTKVRELAPQLRKAYEQQDLLTRIKTGGIVPSTYKAVLGFLGIEAQGVIDAERFNKLAKEQMVGVLGNFGSNPTEGERASAQELVASINDLTEVNAQTIEAYIRELQYSYDDYQRVLRKGSTPQSVADARLKDVDAIIQRAKKGNKSLPSPTDVQDGKYYTQDEG